MNNLISFNHLFTTPYVLISDYRSELGESPVWCWRSQSLLWVDILQQKLLRYWPEHACTVVHDLPFVTSAALLTSTEEVFLLVTTKGILSYDYSCQQFDKLCDYPDNPDYTRPNEAAIAPDGALWFGTMDPRAQRRIGSWYRYEAGTQCALKIQESVLIPNTLIWYKEHLWCADTASACFYSVEQTDLSWKTRRSQCVDGKTPDGSTVTTEGLLINAHWGAACLDCYQIENRQLIFQYKLSLPVQQPSSCTFGGKHLTDLYITSARMGLESANPQEGAVLKIPTPVQGCRANLFPLDY